MKIDKTTPRPWKLLGDPEKMDHQFAIANVNITEDNIRAPQMSKNEPELGVVGTSEWLWLTKEDAELIVKAVNCHDKLVENLEAAVRYIENNSPQCLRLDEFQETLKQVKNEK
jgi:hypothetical protein